MDMVGFSFSVLLFSRVGHKDFEEGVESWSEIWYNMRRRRIRDGERVRGY